MVKKSKRKQDIKSKLMAAVAMLMVATIMMVSSTYAWFTLSTAPEVQGITTTVGSNGSLEIALSPADGGTNVPDANLNTGADWTEKNLTWGNLLDLSDASYGLGDLMLLPAQLVASAKAGGGYMLTNSPLATPNYGADGRIQGLLKNTMAGGLRAGAEGYYENGDYGVRAVGTSDTLSEQALVYKNNIAGIKNHANKAAAAASKSLNENGSALATILVQYASESGTEYKDFVDELQALTADLNTSVNELAEMLRSALLVATTPISDAAQFAAIRTQIEAATAANLADLIDDIETAGGVKFAGIDDAAAKVAAVAQKVQTAKSAADGLDATGTVAWGDIDDVMNNLMDINGDITVGGHTISTIQENKNDFDFLFDVAQNCVIELGAGSGVYYDIAAIGGNFNATVYDVVISGQIAGQVRTLTIDEAIIRTKFAGTTAADALYAGGSGVTASGDGASQVISVNYGYIVDFMFRTNASGSNLLLQTEGAQRIYGDDQTSNPDTLGKGSVFTFTTTEADRVDEITRLMESINVVFFAPGSLDVYGIAGVTSVDTVEEAGVHTITGTLELCGYTVADELVSVGTANGTNTLCALPQNTATAVSALVYLDGNTVTNADVLNNENVTGALNLQFASSVDLVPMENTALMNAGTEVKYDAVVKAGGVTLRTFDKAATQGATYTVDLDEVLNAEQLAQLETATVNVTMGGVAVPGAYTAETHVITVTNVSGAIEVDVVLP